MQYHLPLLPLHRARPYPEDPPLQWEVYHLDSLSKDRAIDLQEANICPLQLLSQLLLLQVICIVPIVVLGMFRIRNLKHLLLDLHNALSKVSRNLVG